MPIRQLKEPKMAADSIECLADSKRRHTACQSGWHRARFGPAFEVRVRCHRTKNQKLRVMIPGTLSKLGESFGLPMTRARAPGATLNSAGERARSLPENSVQKLGTPVANRFSVTNSEQDWTPPLRDAWSRRELRQTQYTITRRYYEK